MPISLRREARSRVSSNPRGLPRKRPNRYETLATTPRYVIHNAEFVSWAHDAAKSGQKFHAVLSDPPYGLKFMGKEWDDVGGPEAFQAQAAEWGRALLPLLYPGALVFMFGGTRMWHRLAAGMEDAGFHLWDTLMWLYGQGFPKAQDISKLIDKAQGNERPVVGVRTDGVSSPGISTKRPTKNEGICVGKFDVTAPGSEISAWTGHKTPQLKPAWEPILCFRAPSDGKKYAELAIEFGSGALNIDAVRIATDENRSRPPRTPNKIYGAGSGTSLQASESHPEGRYPANLALDEEAAERLDAQTGGASRFFYCAKASSSERNAASKRIIIQR